MILARGHWPGSPGSAAPVAQPGRSSRTQGFQTNCPALSVPDELIQLTVFPTSVQPSHAGLRGWSTRNKRGKLEGRRLPKFPRSSACGLLVNRHAETATKFRGLAVIQRIGRRFSSLTLTLPLCILPSLRPIFATVPARHSQGPPQLSGVSEIVIREPSPAVLFWPQLSTLQSGPRQIQVTRYKLQVTDVCFEKIL